jgi:hypothetical protein
LGGILADFEGRTRFPGASLVVEHDEIGLGIEEPPVIR